jgi:ATP-dependent Clp protease ATP-binding subunit ClpB
VVDCAEGALVFERQRQEREEPAAIVEEAVTLEVDAAESKQAIASRVEAPVVIPAEIVSGEVNEADASDDDWGDESGPMDTAVDAEPFDEDWSESSEEEWSETVIEVKKEQDSDEFNYSESSTLVNDSPAYAGADMDSEENWLDSI